MKQIAPSVPLRQPSLVPPSAEQSHTSQPIPPQTTTTTRVQNGSGEGSKVPELEFDSRAAGVSRLQP